MLSHSLGGAVIFLSLQHFIVEVCVPELILNETRQDQTGGQFPNWRDRYKTTITLWSRCLGKSGYLDDFESN